MPQGKANCCCGGCNVKQTGANACRKCIPKYLCVEVVVTPGPYSKVTDCCKVFGFRIPYGCANYAGTGTCPDGVSVDIAVTLADTAEGCTTTVSSSLLAYPLVYSGTLPAMSFVVENSAGDTLTITIGTANVVPNPMSLIACAPCTCQACLPAALCLLISAQGHYPDNPALCPAGKNVTVYKRVAAIATLNCSQYVVADQTIPVDPDWCPGTAKAFSMSITLLADQCAIRFVGSLGTGSVDEILVLEAPLHPCKITGTECISEEILDFRLGTPALRPDCIGGTDPQAFLSFIDVTLHFLDYMGKEIGTVRVRDQSCGQCETCEFPDQVAECCDPITGPTAVTLTCAAGSTPFAAGAPNSWGQSGGGACFPGQTTPYSISCTFQPGNDLWVLNKFGDGPSVQLYGKCQPVLYLTGGGYTVTE